MKRLCFIAAAAFLLTACGNRSLGYPADTETAGLNSLMQLQEGENVLHTADFIMNVADIDSVTSDCDALTVSLSEDKEFVNVTAPADMAAMANVIVWAKGAPYAIPVKRSDKVEYRFTYDPQGKKHGRVQIAGQMNFWVPTMTPDLTLGEDGKYSVKLTLSPGTYMYQLVIDGVQAADPTNPNKVDNGFGQFNSVLTVRGNDDKFPRLTTDRIDGDKIAVSIRNDVEKVYAYWQNYLLPERFVEVTDGKVEVTVPADAAQLERSYIRIWAVNGWGVSNDVLVPLQRGKAVTDAQMIGRKDKQGKIIYFLLVDRFKNGNPDNDHPMNRPDVNPKADYQGGDLEGIRQQVDNGYFNALGVNTLWVSPLNQNPLEPYGYNADAKTKFAGYHGYWPISSSQVDFRFGTNDELKGLVKDAHSHGINILLDYVANHVHENHPLYKEHPEYATQLHLPDGRLNIGLWDEQRLTTWFDTFIPSLDYSNPEVVELMSDSGAYWMREFGIDGFRHDACKHVDLAYWRALTRKLKAIDPTASFYQIGETYGSPELISSYVNSGMLDAQFDFNLYEEANSAFNGVSGGTLSRVMSVMQSSLKVYGSHHLMGNISGNHDKPRFMALASGDLVPGEDSHAAGWTREIGITDSTAYDRLALFHAFNMTIPGVPVIYYGDEIGMTGGNDPDCRRMMYFDGWNVRERGLFDRVSALAHLRTDNMAMMYGDFISLENTDETWVYARKYFDSEAVVLLNNGSEPKTFDVALNGLDGEGLKALVGESEFSAESGRLRITLPALSYEVLYR